MSRPILNSLALIFAVPALMLPSLLMAATPSQQQVQKLLASDGEAGAYFGWSVAVSGDTAVIGAPRTDHPGNGRAYVYTRDAAGLWTEQARLQASDGAPEDQFAVSVALSGGTVVIGASDDDDNGELSGSAYVYTRTGGGAWVQQAKLLASDGEAEDQFGISVAVSGDTAVIGAAGDDGAASASGSAYVFTRDAGGTWTEQTRLVASDGVVLAAFGTSVSLSGETAVVGAWRDDDNGTLSGSAYVYARDASGEWFEQAKLVASDGAAQDFFGRSVAVSDDTAVIGADRDGDNGNWSGSAYVYARGAGGVWTQQAKLLASDGAADQLFGASVAVSGDTAVVGALRADSAYTYTRTPSGEWSEQVRLVASDDGADAGGEWFGQSAAIDGNTVLIGAPIDEIEGVRSGSAYVFRTGVGQAMLHCAGDINGDGVSELALATPTGQVRVKNLAGAWVNGFELAGPTHVIDSELMADTNTNGASELVLLESGGAGAQVRDLLTGGSLGSTSGGVSSPVDLEVMPDRTGNGIPEIAVLGGNPVTVEVRDGLTAEAIGRVAFSNYVVPQDLAIYPDASGNGWPELAVLGDNRIAEDADKIEIRDPATGAVVRQIWLGRHWQVIDQALIADLNGNGSKEVVVLRTRPDGKVHAQIRDTSTRQWMNFVGFAVKYPPQAFVPIPDIDGNGADELVVFGRRDDGSNQKAVIKDSRTGHKLGELWFDRRFPGQDLVSCGDVDGNGAEDVAFLGQRASDGRYKVVVKDSRSGERLAMLWF